MSVGPMPEDPVVPGESVRRIVEFADCRADGDSGIRCKPLDKACFEVLGKIEEGFGGKRRSFNMFLKLCGGRLRYIIGY